MQNKLTGDMTLYQNSSHLSNHQILNKQCYYLITSLLTIILIIYQILIIKIKYHQKKYQFNVVLAYIIRMNDPFI